MKRASRASRLLPLVPLALGGLLAGALHPGQERAPLAALATALAESRAEVALLRARVVELEAELGAQRAAERGLRERAVGLETELVRSHEDRIAREAQWMEFTRVVASLGADRMQPGELARVLTGPLGEAQARELAGVDGSAEVTAAAAAAPVPRDPALARGAEVLRTLRALLAADEVRGIDLLEVGRVEDGAAGPVVLRLVDERNVTLATLVAERLRLEASRSARSLSLVLEDGYARQGDARIPFEGAPPGAERGGERRIALPRIDPLPWIETLPELFRFDDRAPVVDDGIWNLALVQRAFNVHLAEDRAAGHYRLVGLAGVLDGVLRDAQLEQLDAQGAVRRVLFADRLTLVPQSRGLLLLLEDGAQLRNGRKYAFLDGRYRIFLPRAELEDWTRTGLPGLAAPPDSGLARDSAQPLPARLRR